MNVFKIVISIIGLAGSIACTGYGDKKTDIPLAQVGSEVLTLQEAKNAIPEFIYLQDSLQALKNYRKNWVESKILAQEASRLGLDATAEVQSKLRKARTDILKEALKSWVWSRDSTQADITKKEARNYYERHKNKFQLQDRYIRYRHLKTETLRAAQQAKSDLLQGVSWPEVVEKYGLDKKQTLDNTKQFWPASTALSELEPLHRYLEIIGHKEISPIRNIGGQYHFVQLVEEYAKGEHPDLDWLLNKIEEWLEVEKRRKQFKSYTQNLYLKAQANNEVTLFDVFDDSLTIPDSLSANK